MFSGHLYPALYFGFFWTLAFTSTALKADGFSVLQLTSHTATHDQSNFTFFMVNHVWMSAATLDLFAFLKQTATVILVLINVTGVN